MNMQTEILPQMTLANASVQTVGNWPRSNLVARMARAVGGIRLAPAQASTLSPDRPISFEEFLKGGKSIPLHQRRGPISRTPG